jgi:hypothetical protein
MAMSTMTRQKKLEVTMRMMLKMMAVSKKTAMKKRTMMIRPR